MEFESSVGVPSDAVGAERNRFVRFRTTYTFDCFVDLPRAGHLKILDFGCGEGHSLATLLDRFPNAQFVAADILPGLYFGDHPRVKVVRMTDAVAIDGIGEGFDVIQMNAVFEHLLPDERKTLMPALWRRLAVNGYLVLTETPWRWFPIETHTTSMPFINYLPDRLALAAARHCGLYPKSLTWNEALRAGLRGATVDEIVAGLGATAGSIERVQPLDPRARDMLEVWWEGECRRTPRKALAYRILRSFQRLTGIVVTPWINVVLRKRA